MDVVTHELRGHSFTLLPEKVIYWEAESCLIIADLHLGKASHFRKSGIAVPLHAEEVNFQKLRKLFELYRPERVLFLGDLFHSRHNEVWTIFAVFLRGFPEISFELVQGNHDILPREAFAEAGISVSTQLEWKGFLFTHDRVETALYNLHGHIHPAVRLAGNGGQRATLPCFFFAKEFGILPSFGAFTGSAVLTPKRSDTVYVIAGEEVIAVA